MYNPATSSIEEDFPLPAALAKLASELEDVTDLELDEDYNSWLDTIDLRSVFSSMLDQAKKNNLTPTTNGIVVQLHTKETIKLVLSVAG